MPEAKKMTAQKDQLNTEGGKKGGFNLMGRFYLQSSELLMTEVRILEYCAALINWNYAQSLSET